MQQDRRPQDLDSTLIRRGVSAATVSEMADFADSVEHRPLDKLLAELPGLAALSQSKFELARLVIRRRARALDGPDFEQLRAFAAEIARDSEADVGERILSIFEAGAK